MDTASLRAQTEQQIDQYESYAEADPDNYLIWLKLGDLHHNVSQFERAAACYERCLTLSPDNAVVRGRLASLLISQHRFAEAEAQLRAVLESGEADPALIHNLGLTLFYQKRWPEAESRFRKALDAGLHSPSTLSYLCRTLHHQARLDDAISICQDWIAATNSSDSHAYLALLEMDRGNMAQAQALAAKVLATSPEDVNAANVLGSAALERQEIDKAAEHFRRAVGHESDNGRSWLGLGLTQLYRGQHDEAITSLERATQLMPTSSGTVVALGWAHVSKHDFTRAEREFRRAIEVDRNFAETHGGLAVALAFQRKHEEAKTAAQRARRLDPNGFGAAFAHTILMTARGQEERATAMLSELLQRPPAPGHKPLIEQIQQYFGKQASSTSQAKNDDTSSS